MAKTPGTPKAKTGAPAQFDMNSRERKGGGKGGRGGPGRPTKVSADFIALLRRLNWRYGPKPGCDRPPVVLVLDNGPVHTSKASRAALAERPWITVEWLPRYAPELNDIENVWTRDR